MLKQWRGAIVLCALVILAVLVTACGASTGGGTTTTPTATTAAGSVTCASGTLSTGGSTALGPLVQLAAKNYQAQCSGANITTQLTGSGAGLQGVSSGSLNIGNSDVFSTASKYPGLIDHQVTAVLFTVIINKNVTGVTNLTSQQLTQIYTGKITNWNQVGGPNLPIAVVSRPAGSGTRTTFQTYVMNGTAESVSGANHTTASTSGQVATYVNQTSGAISYDTVHFAQTENLKTISIDGVAPTPANVETNAYKFWNVEHMYTKGAATGLANDFINYVKSPAAQSARQSLGFVDISQISASALAAKQPK
jgi:phosphate transport system substrate-binding protein